MRQGDPITIVQPEQLILIEVMFGSDVDYLLAGPHKLVVADEGITWLKGYHTPDEACVTAARTCQSLREKEQPQGLAGVYGSPGVQGVPGLFGNPFIGCPPPLPPPIPGPAPSWIGNPLSPIPQIGGPWPSVSPDTRLVLVTSNTKGL